MESHSPKEFFNWLPSKLFERDGELFLEWIFLWDIHFEQPFFDTTLWRCNTIDSMKGDEKKGKRITSIDFLEEVAQTVDFITPGLFIFHTSRCGSTLVSQVLSLESRNIVYSEYLIIDAILRATIDGEIIQEEKRKKWLLNLIKIMGQIRFPVEKQMIIKLNSWHFAFHKLFRELYPDKPFAILYREPDAILLSNNKRWGIQFLPEFISPSIYNIDIDSINPFSLNTYANHVLQGMYSHIRKIISEDKNILLLDYNNGMDKNINILIRILKMEASFMDFNYVKERMKFHSKNPDIVFNGDRYDECNLAFEDTLRLYNIIKVSENSN